ncbi:MAG: alpha-L-fucosidase [Planctomycetota bacterium]|jgi:alpha-L-fucosidase
MVQKCFLEILLAAMLVTANLAYGKNVPTNPLEKPGWKLDFHDEFDGPELNEKVWLPYYLPHLTTRERAAADYEFRDGAIVIKIEKDHPAYRDNWGNKEKGHMLVSSIQTFEKDGLHGKVKDGHYESEFDGYTTKYGYFEIRAKAPAGSGGHIAWWMVGCQDEPGQNAEIDIVENPFHLSTIMYANIHAWNDPSITKEEIRTPLGFDIADTWHVYGFEWGADGMKFYVDNILVGKSANSPNYRMATLLGLYRNCGWDGKNDGVYPKEFIVDYYRVYKKDSSTADKSFDLDAHKQKISEWQDLKYGLFVHWGPCSVAGIEIGWARKAPRQGEGIGTWYPGNSIPAEQYDNLYKQFNPVDFDADQWMETIKKAGMKYIVLTAKHVDGFMLWDTKTSDYNIMNSPYGKDICKEIADACHKHGVKLGWYYAPCDWHDLDCRNPDPARHQRYIKRMQEQLRELMTHYGKVDILWTDTDGGDAVYDQDNTYAMVRKLQPGIVINNRMEFNRRGMGAGLAGWKESWLKRQAGQPAEWKDFGDYDAGAEGHVGAFNPLPNESCISMIHGQWAWQRNATLYSATDGANLLVNSLINNGNLLYNIGPMPTGEIHHRQKDRLLKTGKWLGKVSDAVYGTRGGPIPGGQWGGTTIKGKNVYLFLPDHTVNGWAKDKPYPLTPLDKKLVSAQSLTGEKISAQQNSDGVVEIMFPKAVNRRIDGDANYMVIKMIFDKENPQMKEDTNLSMDNVVKQANIKPGSNIAFVGTATMDLPAGWGHLAQHAIDGNSGTYAQSSMLVWDLSIDLGKSYPIDTIRIHPSSGGWASEYSIKVSTDNQNWTTIDTIKKAGFDMRTIEFDEIDARYVWMDVTGVGHEGNFGHAINEFKIYMAK